MEKPTDDRVVKSKSKKQIKKKNKTESTEKQVCVMSQKYKCLTFKTMNIEYCLYINMH